MRAAAAWLVVALVMAGCGPREENIALDFNQMNQLAQHGTAGAPQGPRGTTGLQPLTPADLGGAQPSCLLTAGEGPVMAYVAGVALVKRDGQIVRLAPDGPVDGTGGFFHSDAISVSVGRTSVAEANANMQAPRSPRARVRVNDRAANASNAFEADWRCGAPG